MASLFEELGVFDRPEVNTKITVGKKKVDVIARKPSAFEQDAIDAFEMDEYGRLITESTVSKNGNLSEIDRVRNIYKSRPKSDIIEQLLPTRQSDIQRMALDLSGIDVGAEALKMSEMKEDELTEYVKTRDLDFEQYQESARDQIRSEMQHEAAGDLVERISQIKINLKANRQAKTASNAHFLFYTLYRPDGKGDRAFENVEQVKNTFTADTIMSAAEEVREALVKDPELPFDLPDDLAPDGPGSSPKNSEPERTDSGNSIAEI